MRESDTYWIELRDGGYVEPSYPPVSIAEPAAARAVVGTALLLTEYALIDFSGQPRFPSGGEQAAFVRTSTAMLGGLPFVERYAWFSLPSTGDAGTGLYRDDGTPTEAGAAYRSA